MVPVVVLPVKSFGDGMKRLSGTVQSRVRSDLGRAIAGHVAETVDRAGLIPLVVTGDPEVATWAAELGFPPLPEPKRGLDSAAAAGVGWAMQSNSPWLVLHSDLPLLQMDDVLRLAGHLADGRDVIAPSSDGGTTAIGSSRRIDFRFGPGSFHRHLARLEGPVVVTSIGLLHDIDTGHDLASAARLGRSNWMATYIDG